MPDIGDQVVTVVNHVPIRPNNRKLPRNTLHPGRVICSIKSIRSDFWLLSRMVGDQEADGYFRMPRFRPNQRCLCHAVKAAVMTDEELCHPVFGYVPLDRFIQRIANTVRCVTVPEKKQDVIVCVPC